MLGMKSRLENTFMPLVPSHISFLVISTTHMEQKGLRVCRHQVMGRAVEVLGMRGSSLCLTGATQALFLL